MQLHNSDLKSCATLWPRGKSDDNNYLGPKFTVHSTTQRGRRASFGRHSTESCASEIANESGDQLTNGAVGEVLVKGPTVMSGYLNNPVETQRHGWLHTGDYGQLDDVVSTLMDRRHDLIILAALIYHVKWKRPYLTTKTLLKWR